MPNTISSSLYPARTRDQLIKIAGDRLAPLAAFTTDFSSDPAAPLATVVVPLEVTAPTVQTDPTNFASGDTELGDVSVTLHRYSASVHVTDAQANRGIKLEWMIPGAVRALCNKLSDVVTALMVSGNYASPLTIGTAANFDVSDLGPILEAGEDYNQRNVLLAPTHLAYVAPNLGTQFRTGQPGCGFDGIWEHGRWTSGEANIAGFLCDPSAIAIASAIPSDRLSVHKPSSVTEIITLEPLGLSIALSRWHAPNTGISWTCLDLLFGAAVGDAASGKILVSA